MFFDNMVEAPADSLFGIKQEFLADKRDEKIFLSIGVFQNDSLEMQMHSSVKNAVEKIGSYEVTANYLPLDGYKGYLDGIGKILFGEEFFSSNYDRIYKAQSVGGTSALRIISEVIFQYSDGKIFVTNPSWDNHGSIFSRVGLEVFLLPFYDKEQNKMDFDAFYHSVETISDGSVLLLHGACHNPTGEDFSEEQWMILSELIKRKKILPFFDFAYHGFKQGIEEDSFAVRYFAEQGHEMFVAYSCSKNFSLYRQRVGALFFVGANTEDAKKVGSHIKKTIRVNYSNPPSFGSKVVETVLTDKDLKKQWIQDLENVRNRLTNMRRLFSKKLSEKSCRDFSFMERQSGMFSLLGITPDQVEKLKESYAIYLPKSGRICFAGLNEGNLNYVAESIARVL